MPCPGRAGGRPDRPVNRAWNGASAGQLAATTNWAGSGLPFRPSRTARPLTVPSAADTSGSRRIAATIDAGTGGVAAPPPPPAPPARGAGRPPTPVAPGDQAHTAATRWVRLAGD